MLLLINQASAVKNRKSHESHEYQMDHKFDFCQVQFLKLFLSNAWIGFQEFAVYLVAEFSNSFSSETVVPRCP